MSAVAAFAGSTVRLPVPANARGAAQAAGAILLACRVARGGLVLFGWHGARLPRQGQASLDAAGQSASGPYRLHAWRRDEAGTAWFIAALQVREAAAMEPGARIALHGPARAGIVLGSLPEGSCLPAALAERLAADSVGQAGPLALFLAALCAAAPAIEPLRQLLSAYLDRAAEEDGVIEIIGRTADALMLQGWGRPAGEEGCTALIIGTQVSSHPLTQARFSRADIAAPATGVVALLDAAADADPAGLGAIHLACGAALRRRRVLPERTILGASDVAAHLRDIMPRLECDAESAARFARQVRPRFAGHDTVSALERPVRAAIDLAVLLPGAGAYLCGWLADAAALVREVTLCDGAGARHRLDAGWTRLKRPDVTQAFSADQRFAALADARDAHGFAAFVPDHARAAAAGTPHLEIALDDTAAFLPLSPARGDVRALLRRAFESVDLHRPGGHAAIAAQLGPLLRAVLRAGLTPPEADVLRASGGSPARALLLPLPPSGGPPHAALSFLLADPLHANEALVLVAPPCWSERDIAALDRGLELYGIEATVLQAGDSCEWTEALELAARATTADTFLCLGAGILGGAPGWREALAARLAVSPRGGVVFPTALYEDNAVRSAGVSAIEPLAAAPWVRVRRPHAGEPFAGKAAPAGPLVAGSLAGAIVSRSAWRAAGGFAGGGMLAPAQELAFFRRLAEAGGRLVHQPEIHVFALGDTAPGPRWRQAAALADGWVLGASVLAKEPA